MVTNQRVGVVMVAGFTVLVLVLPIAVVSSESSMVLSGDWVMKWCWG